MSKEEYSAFGPQKTRRANCPECAKETRVDTLFSKVDRWNNEEADIQGLEEYYVFQCRGCETTFFAQASSNSEDYYEYEDPYTGGYHREYNENKILWPAAPSRPSPDWANFDLKYVDRTLWELMNELYAAINDDLRVLSAIACRTALDRVTDLLGIDTSISFAEKLEALRKGGHISGVQKGTLIVLVDAGGAAAHAGWKPKREEVYTMINALEALVHEHFVIKADIANLKEKIPSKKMNKK